jgi:hypothetical protein
MQTLKNPRTNSEIQMQELKETKEAINQAEYFYQKMDETIKIPLDFRTNLNAFLLRSRTITWVLKKELSKNPHFASWYASQEKLMKKDELMVFFVDARNISEKEHPIKPTTSTFIRNMTVVGDGKKGFAITSEGEPVWIEKSINGEERKIHAKEFDDEISKSYYFIDPQPPKTFELLQVIDLCGLYLKALKQIVDEASVVI